MSAVAVDAIWNMLPVRMRSLVQDNDLRVSLIRNSVMRVYRDLAECFSERIKFTLTEGGIQTLPCKEEYIRITGAKYRGQNLPAIRNGKTLEIPISFTGIANENDFFELCLTRVPEVYEENGGQFIELDARIKMLLRYSLMLELYFYGDSDTENENYKNCKRVYDSEKVETRTVLSGVQYSDQIYENAATVASGIPSFEM